MTLLNSLRAHAQRTPHAPALVHPGTTLSWHETADTVQRIAARLHAHGVRPGQLIGISPQFSPVMQCVLMLSIWHRSAISCIPQATSAVTPDLTITPTPLPDAASTPQLLLDHTAMGALAHTAPLGAETPYASLEDTLHLVFSSGSTGTPKGIPITLRQLSDRMRRGAATWLTVRPFLSLLDVTSITGFVAFAHAIRTGAPCYLPGSAEQSCEAIERYGIRGIAGSPVQLAALTPELEQHPAAAEQLTRIVSAGSTLPNQLRDQLHTLTAAAVVSLYGSSEIGGIALGEPSDSETGLAGRILPETEVRIVDEQGIPLPEHHVGTVQVRRTLQLAGYYRDPEATAQAFADGWFSPGDRGSLSGGNLYLAGRNTEVLNIGGVKYVPSELEQALLTLPGITDVAVTSAETGTGMPELVVLYVGSTTHGTPVSGTGIAGRLGTNAPHRSIRVNEIPRNSNGKIDRAATQKLAAQ